MCTEYIDLRAKITHETDAWLDTETKATGKDRAELVREMLHKIAIDEIHKSIVRYSNLQSKGMVRESSGNARESSGNARESSGNAREFGGMR